MGLKDKSLHQNIATINFLLDLQLLLLTSWQGGTAWSNGIHGMALHNEDTKKVTSFH